jgi:transposase-like protein
VIDHRGDYPSEWAAIKAVSKRLGMNAETLGNWIRQQQVDDGQRDGVAPRPPRGSSSSGVATPSSRRPSRC